MPSSRFTVLLGVHREPTLLPYAMETALWQSHEDFELFVVCDGAPAATVECANGIAARDSRIRVFDLEKGEGRGERHRDAVLAMASGDFVAHLAYDDLWFPDHLKELADLLSEVEFGNLQLMAIAPDGSFLDFPGDLADADARRRLLSEEWNFFGPSVAGYRLSTYRRLPEGWVPAPPGVWSDLHMWRKFLRLDGITAKTRFTLQSLCLHDSLRHHMTLEQRQEETKRWMEVIRDPAQRAALTDRYWGALAKSHVQIRKRLAQHRVAADKEIMSLRLKLGEVSQSKTHGAHTMFSELVAREFDREWYLSTNPDVAAANVDPLDHWLSHGIWEGRQLNSELQLKLQASGGTETTPLYEYKGTMFAAHYAMPEGLQVANQPGLDPYIARLREVHRKMDPCVPAGATIFLGDGIMMALATAAVTPCAVNYGIGSQRSDELIESMSIYQSIQRAGRVVVMVGTNDLLQGREAGIEARYQAILARIPPDIPVTLSSVPPLGLTKFAGRWIGNDNVQYVVASARTACESHCRCEFIDLHADLSEDGRPLPGVLMADGIHLATPGYERWIGLLRRANTT